MGISVRLIDNERDFHAVARLRHDVLVGEQGRKPHGIDAARRTVADDLDPLARVYGAFEDGGCVASGRIVPVAKLPPASLWRAHFDTSAFPVPEAQQVIYGRLLVRESHRGSMAIPQILVQGYEQVRAEGVEVGFLQCAPSLVPLYEVVGCRRYRKGVMDPDAGFRLPMVQLLGDHELFTRVRSPILNSVKRFPANPQLAQWFQESFPQYSRPASVRMLDEEEFLRTLSQHVGQERSPLFEGLGEGKVQMLLRASAVIELAAGETILRRGDPGSEMYLVLEGAVEIATTQADGGRRVLRTLGYGQFFGEGGFLFGERRSADVTAIAPTRLLTISAEGFDKVIEKRPELAAKVLLNLSRVLCQRLYAGN